MMNRIDKLFAEKKQPVLNVYCTAGYPRIDSTAEVIMSLQESGADLIEIGMPYSDPLADGPVIQQSNMVALQNGMTIPLLLDQLNAIKYSVSVPVILMGYMNPVMQLGMEKFCSAAAGAGVDGIILPDLPIYEYETEYSPFFEKNGLKFIFLITPETTEERIRKIDSLSGGFIYAVSSSSTTGNERPISQQEAYFRKLQALQLKNPVLVGFGIKDKATFKAATAFTRGAIIGSAYIKAIQHTLDIEGATKKFLNSVIGG